MSIEGLPFVQELVKDDRGIVRQVVLQLEDYQRLMEAMEDEGLWLAMQEVQGEVPLSLEAALKEMEQL
jgi:RelB Antitoxin alpha helical domain